MSRRPSPPAGATATRVHVRDAHAILRELDVDANELALVYRARGVPPEEAHRRAAAVLRSGDPTASALGDGRAPDDDGYDVVGTGLGAALSSFCFFASGALIPILPYLFGMTGTPAILLAAGLVGVALLGTGAVVGVLSGAPPLRRALRQLAIGYGAAAVTYGLGLLVGTAVG